jgi:hypothetical protein
VRGALCSTCGRPLDEHDRHLRFRLPQPVLETVPDDDERVARSWGNDVLMQVQDVGSFIRILVPVSLTGGFTMTYGAWLSVHPDDLRRAWEEWWGPAYSKLRIEGILANRLPPWEEETYRKLLTATPRVPNEIPYAASSADKRFQEILQREWDHDLVLEAVDRYGA